MTMRSLYRPATSDFASRGKSGLLVSRMAKKVSGFDGRSGFILENMKHTGKKKTLKNIGQALIREIFILKVVEKRDNYMKTEKVMLIFFIILADIS